ncbi:MAG: aminomethyl-transferring glycine dehydrogenase subunit GcvPA [SAR202 cluster bacterium]|jgi:glycine dehydrogenase subunit 1|nr:aminomethyl-transferring glycine dehydrogenase subunit GcvPA [SAR202 cluster bacterium]MDP6663378.1 aminomethyl-transferring glycine dehydrogenase subunit GcvPA [SAR202 cluster bacterium]MDP6799390.1 aminomethyl-transferring glycine dehydrogenase subunit GcvPA [SAR202 cluster bacterium]MQG57850.1 aminomethyl-transferring glycine dehydrogenase subunit GcvPA [SAR202 cluster bacterium]
MPEDAHRSPYIPNTDSDRRAMLDAIGAASVEELFEDLPDNLGELELDLPPARSELELMQHAQELASMNRVPGDYACFLGAGSYRHHVPAIVRQITSRSEFVTAYTPYQPEVSQGTLQTAYEFQTLVCQLTGMEVANLGMYDGASSLAEATLMAARITGRNRVAVAGSLSPPYREVLNTYAQAPGLAIDTLDPNQPDLADGTACVIVQQPNFHGYMEDVDRLSALAHDNGALLIVSVDPVSLGMFRPPSDYDADIVVGEGQAMGVPPAFGGPYVGLFACKQQFVRQMPGRIVGKTVDTRDRTAYVLTLQTREQHIRRERATSNICTAATLVALMSTVYMASFGKQGLRRVAELCYHKAHYAASLIDDIPGYSLALDGTFFQEFVVICPMPPSEINERLLDHKIIGGLDIDGQIPNGMLVCVTELNSREEIDRLAAALAEIGATA